MAIEALHRNKNGEVSKKYGDALVRTFRKHYGPSFAKGYSEREKLSDVLDKLDESSLSRLIQDHKTGTLELMCQSPGSSE